ncbi:uncharacterized protein [Littorina saxatilis]|uniref:uncharacterized protein n=1 Tax=Littorina saxatilis TaxID=31220 RepID=UPI0038B6AF60
MNGLAGAVSITNCESPRSYVPGVSYNNFPCYFSGNTTSNISWTIAKDDGTTMNLGTCNPVCNKSYRSAALQLKGKTTANAYGYCTPRYFFELSFNDTGNEFDGSLICTETFANGTVESASCRQKAVRIRATRREIGVRENSASSYALCYDQRQPGSTVTWTLVTDSGHTIDLGTCSGSDTCTSMYPNVTLTRSRTSGYSRARFRYWQRDMGGQLICSYIKDGVKDTDNTTLTVYNPATFDNCSVDISRPNWTAILSCEVTRVFVSSGAYTYRLKMTSECNVRYRWSFHSDVSEIYIFEDPQSYRDALTL